MKRVTWSEGSSAFCYSVAVGIKCVKRRRAAASRRSCLETVSVSLVRQPEWSCITLLSGSRQSVWQCESRERRLGGGGSCSSAAVFLVLSNRHRSTCSCLGCGTSGNSRTACDLCARASGIITATPAPVVEAPAPVVEYIQPAPTFQTATATMTVTALKGRHSRRVHIDRRLSPQGEWWLSGVQHCRKELTARQQPKYSREEGLDGDHGLLMHGSH